MKKYLLLILTIFMFSSCAGNGAINSITDAGSNILEKVKDGASDLYDKSKEMVTGEEVEEDTDIITELEDNEELDEETKKLIGEA